jgi:tRNA1Val (adenine37-N6)-methyltransferase
MNQNNEGRWREKESLPLSDTPASLEEKGRKPVVNADETLDRLAGKLRIIQKKQGQRAASDDVFLSWAAARVCPEASRALDLGSGKGTVAMLLLCRLSQCNVIGIEVLELSHDLARRNALLNGLENRYEPRLGDLRDPLVLVGEPLFDLITGAPPFKPLGTGTLPRNAQRAASRFEMRGGVREYAATAAAHLAPQGKVVLLMDGLEQSRARAEQAFAAVGLFPHWIIGVRPRPQRPPVYWILAADRMAGGAVEESVCMRPEFGNSWSLEYDAIRREMDLPA